MALRAVRFMQSCYGKPGLVNQLGMGLAMPNPHDAQPVEAPQSVNATQEVPHAAAPARLKTPWRTL